MLDIIRNIRRTAYAPTVRSL